MRKRFFSAAVALALLGSHHAQAGVMVGGTRVIFEGKKREASISVKNEDKAPYVVQTWLDSGDDKVKGNTPFAVIPPIFRLDPGKENLLRIMSSGKDLPQDRESVYWLNVQEIPPAPEQENTLQIAVRTRIKLFYRPAGLAGDPAKAPAALQWKLERNEPSGRTVLVARNASAFAVNLAAVKLNAMDGNQELGAGMVLPKDERHFELKKQVAPSGTPSLTYTYINDYGGESQPIEANGANAANK
jgi:fimbrial chaperone protein